MLAICAVARERPMSADVTIAPWRSARPPPTPVGRARGAPLPWWSPGLERVQRVEQGDDREVGRPPDQRSAHHPLEVAHGLLARMNDVDGERGVGGDGAAAVRVAGHAEEAIDEEDVVAAL